MNTSPFAERRRRLIARMGEGAAVIPTAPERIRNRDTTYPYRADSYFHYLTGFPEPEAVLVLIAGEPARSLLFCREKNPDKEVWDGFRHGPSGACETFGLDEAYPMTLLDEKLPEILADRPALWYSVGYDTTWDARMTAALNAVRGQARTGRRAPRVIRDIRTELDEMRLIKDDNEIGLLRRLFSFRVRALIGQSCVVETASNLRTWTPLKTNVVPTPDPFTFTDPTTPPQPQRCYRVRLR